MLCLISSLIEIAGSMLNQSEKRYCKSWNQVNWVFLFLIAGPTNECQLMWMWARDPSWHPAPRARDKKSRIIFFPLARTHRLAGASARISIVWCHPREILFPPANVKFVTYFEHRCPLCRRKTRFNISNYSAHNGAAEVLIDFDHIVASIAGTPPPLFLSSYQLENLWKINLTWLGLSLVLHLRYLTPCWVAELLLLQSALFWLKRI